MFDQLIIGGGIHGTLLQLSLKRRGVEHGVIDPHPEPLARWNRTTAACGMRYLRSTSSHGLELDFHALRRFARERGYGSRHFIPPYLRPSLELFSAYASHLVESEGLDTRIRDEITSIRREAGAYLLLGKRGTYRARRLILAPGSPEPKPPWEGDRFPKALHVFDRRFRLEEIEGEQEVAIVGAGVTGGQLAVHLAGKGVSLTLIEMKAPVQADYDGNPCYVGPRCAEDFERITSPAERRARITSERYPGTLPRDVYDELLDLIARGRVRLIIGRFTGLKERGGGLEVRWETTAGPGGSGRFDRVIAATGFAPGPPAAALVAGLADTLALPTGPSGYPFPDSTLEWGEGIYLSGALAELVIGPPARNIIGAHLAARRILPAFEAIRAA
ncbi:MAG: FAD-dependent oxidoreductase [Spirochaetaceae bacterium]